MWEAKANVTSKTLNAIALPSLNCGFSYFESDAILAQYVTQVVKTHLCLKTDPVFIKFTEYEHSYLFKFIISTKSSDVRKSLAVKLYKARKSVDTPFNPSDNSCFFLEKISSFSPEIPQLVVPRSVMKLTELNGFVREWIDGNDLATIMMGGRSSFNCEKKKLPSYFKKIGEVIGLIHNQTYSSDATSAKSFTISKVAAINRQICNSYLKNSKYVKRTMTCIEDAISTIAWKNVGVTLTHGDLVHSNIVLPPDGGVALIDFAESRYDLPYHDISRFMVRTMIDYGWVHHRYPSSYIAGLNSRFFEGYLSSMRHKIKSDVFQCFSIFNTLQFISLLYKSGFRSFLSVRDWYALFLLRNHPMQLWEAN